MPSCPAFSHKWLNHHKYARTCVECGKHQIHWNYGELPDNWAQWVPDPFTIAIIFTLTLVLIAIIKRWLTVDCQQYESILTDIKHDDELKKEAEAARQRLQKQEEAKLKLAKQTCKYAHHHEGE